MQITLINVINKNVLIWLNKQVKLKNFFLYSILPNLSSRFFSSWSNFSDNLPNMERRKAMSWSFWAKVSCISWNLNRVKVQRFPSNRSETKMSVWYFRGSLLSLKVQWNCEKHEHLVNRQKPINLTNLNIWALQMRIYMLQSTAPSVMSIVWVCLLTCHQSAAGTPSDPRIYTPPGVFHTCPGYRWMYSCRGAEEMQISGS